MSSIWRYHVSQPSRLLAGALALALLLAVPYIRYRALHPNVVLDQLRVIDSYWMRPAPLRRKLAIFAKTYVTAFHPSYWFMPDRYDLERHRMKGMGFLPFPLLPFAAAGLAVCLRRLRSPPHRVALIAIPGVPFSAAAASIGIMRVLSMVVPFALFACLGLEEVLERIRRPRWRGAFTAGLAAVFSAASLWMLRSAIVEGPTWSSNYGLYGLQYGSRQVFAAIREELARSRDTEILVSPTWSNNPEAFVRYFLRDSERERVRFANLDQWQRSKHELDPDFLFVLTPPEYEAAVSSRKFELRPERVLPYPDGRPGFYFVRASYSTRIDELIAADVRERQRLVEQNALVQGETVRVRHSPLDEEPLENALDGKRDTLLRGAMANPFVFEFDLPRSRNVGGLALDLGSMEFRLRIELQLTTGGKPLVFTGDFANLPPDPHLEFSFPRGPHRISRARIEILDVHSGETAQVHVREVAFR